MSTEGVTSRDQEQVQEILSSRGQTINEPGRPNTMEASGTSNASSSSARSSKWKKASRGEKSESSKGKNPTETSRQAKREEAYNKSRNLVSLTGENEEDEISAPGGKTELVADGCTAAETEFKAPAAVNKSLNWAEEMSNASLHGSDNNTSMSSGSSKLSASARRRLRRKFSKMNAR